MFSVIVSNSVMFSAALSSIFSRSVFEHMRQNVLEHLLYMYLIRTSRHLHASNDVGEVPFSEFIEIKRAFQSS